MHDTTWDPDAKILRTRLEGTVSTAEVTAWRDGLHGALADVPDGTALKLLLDIRGFEAADLEAHKTMRVVVPQLLVAHGMRPAFLDLFEDQPEPAIAVERGVAVVAFANVHHDAAKMDEYDRRIGRDGQRFFTDIVAAERWLEASEPSPAAAVPTSA